MNFASDNSEDHNLPFSLTELKQALQKSKDSATGLDGVHYQLLTHLPDKTVCLLLHVYNKTWESGSFPSWWREAAIIPIPKHGIDTSNPRKYRPVALTNCLVKRWNEWSLLAWCGLWSHRVFCLRASVASEEKKNSTLDHFVRFETFTRDAFVKRNIFAPFSLIWRRLTIQRGNMVSS